ncbi:MAG: hypothetical protein KDC52_20730, partial [Ignavibacteriae bacterium]|nr:hypothetical protein [Ignavibacteriota bacterium]
MRYNTFLFTGLLLLSVSIYAQESETDGKKSNKIEGTEKVDSPQAVGDKVRIKDGTTTLIEINNEGSAGSILLPSVGGLLSGSKLYSNGVNLFWGSSQLNGGGGATKINDLSDAKSDGSSLFLGSGAGANDNGTSNLNTAIGINALNLNLTAGSNTAIGNSSLYNNRSSFNTAIGYNSMFNNTTGTVNVASGFEALFSNTIGNHNTANGNKTLYNNVSGNFNTAVGSVALTANTTGYSN